MGSIGMASLVVFVASLVSALAVTSSSSSTLLRRSAAARRAAAAAEESAAARRTTDSSGQAPPTTRVQLLMKTLRQFEESSRQGVTAAELRAQAEEARLTASLQAAQDQGVKLALTQSITSNNQSLQEVSRTYADMLYFGESMSSLLNATGSTQGGGSACEAMACGLHASCTETPDGALCVCNEGYVGSGLNCHAPSEFMPHRLLQDGVTRSAISATSMSVCVFNGNRIAVAFVDLAKGGAGRIVIGIVRDDGRADLSPPDQFTAPGGRAFSPKVQGSSGRSLLLTWRDGDRNATGWVRGASLGAPGVRGADMALSWGEPLIFSPSQDHAASLLAFPGDRYGLMYVDKTAATLHVPAQSFGNAMLLQVAGGGQTVSVGSFRFSDVAVTRLEAAKLGDNAFVLVARSAGLVDDLNPEITTSQQAIAIYGEAVQDDLVFDPNPLNVAPQTSEVWARGVSHIAPNTFAYAYQEATNGQIEMAVGTIDPLTHKMHLAQPSVVVRSEVSPYVSMLSMPYTAADPHTLVYYQSGDASMINVCSWRSATSRIERCEDFTWLSHRLDSVAGVELGGGKALMVFSTTEGIPYYTVLGLSKK
eukprot:TRINITY_DN16030_c0_g1_i2.p1 TRINITY_DN16030_c0_g1~~TRINITY_DN16030_c0_g1_i2.p1  ORF type:complete len:592 (+),score=130.70 TRINITY_DN16030_c0_g1_i2:118-1893(+)